MMASFYYQNLIKRVLDRDGMSVYRKCLKRLELRKTLMRFIRIMTGYMRRVADCRRRKRRNERSGGDGIKQIK